MKKSISLILILFACFVSVAFDYELKGVKVTEKQVTQLSSMKTETIKGFLVEPEKGRVTVTSEVELSQSEQNALKQLIRELPDEYSKDYFEGKFSQKVFFGRIIQELSAEKWFALSKLGVGWTMQQLVEYPNFEGLKDYIAGLKADSTLSDDDANKIDAVLLEQGIDLGKY